MKKILSLLLCIVVITLSFAACKGEKEDLEATTVTTTATTTAEKPVRMGILKDCEPISSFDDFTEGIMSEEQLSRFKESASECLHLGGCYICKNEKGENVVFRLKTGKENSEILKIERYPAVDPTEEGMDKIEEGMTLFDVIRLVGIPDGKSIAEMSSNPFLSYSVEGSSYTITYNHNSGEVLSVSRYDQP